MSPVAPPPFGTCACGVELLQREGFHSTGLCGPCCTGESATDGQVTLWCARSFDGCEGCCEVPAAEMHKPHRCPVCSARCYISGACPDWSSSEPVDGMQSARSLDRDCRISYHSGKWRTFRNGEASAEFTDLGDAWLHLGAPEMYATVQHSPTIPPEKVKVLG